MSLLFDAPPLVVNVSLASEVGLNEAIVLQQIHYWQEKLDRPVYNTYNQWQEQFPFFSSRTVRRTITNLETAGLIISSIDPSDGNKKSYQVNYSHAVFGGRPLSKMDRPSVQNGQTSVQSGQTFQATENTQRIPDSNKAKTPKLEEPYWSEYQQLHDWFNKKRGGKGKANANNLNNFKFWRDTYSLLDMKYAIIALGCHDYWAATTIGLTVILRQRNPSGQPVDYIGDFMSVNPKGFPELEACYEDYRLLRDWFEYDQPVLPKDEAVKIIMALRAFNFTDVEKEYVARVKESLHASAEENL